MDRQAVIEATIDYVMTRLKGRRSVGPAWIRYQEREVHEDVTGAKSFNVLKRQAIQKPAPGTLKPKWNTNKWDQNKRQAIKPISRHRSFTEASTEHVTPGLYRAALKVNREVNKPWRKRKGVSFHGVDSRVSKIMGRTVTTSNTVRRPVGLPKTLKKRGFGGFAHPGFNAVVIPKGEKRPSHDTRNALTHELLHIADKGGKYGEQLGIKRNIDKIMRNVDTEPVAAFKGVGKFVVDSWKKQAKDMKALSRGETKALANYAANPKERHAYSAVAGTLGVRHMKKRGWSRNTAQQVIRKGAHKRNPYIDVAHSLFHGSKAETKGAKRSYRKFSKELVKGLDNTYGSRGKTVGRNKLGVPVGKLPEDVATLFRRALVQEVTEEANPKTTRTERIGPRLWMTKSPKKKMPKAKSTRSRAELIDKITKDRVVTKGKVKATYKQLPSTVARSKKTPQHPVHQMSLGTYLAKHNVNRALVKKARGKSRLPENKMTKDKMIEAIVEAYTPPKKTKTPPKGWYDKGPWVDTTYSGSRGTVSSGWMRSKDPMLADRHSKLSLDDRQKIIKQTGFALHRDIKKAYGKRKGFLWAKAREAGVPAKSRDVGRQAALMMPKDLVRSDARLPELVKIDLKDNLVMHGRGQRLKRQMEKRGLKYTPSKKAKVTRQMNKNRRRAELKRNRRDTRGAYNPGF